MGGNVIYTTLCNISNFEEQFFHKIEQVMRNIVLVNGNTGIWSIGYLPITGVANMRTCWYITMYKVFVKYTFPKWAVCDQFGHVIFPGEFYLKGTYLQKSRSKFPSKKQFTILDFDVYVSPDEVFEPFVGIDTDLRMDINEYIELSQRLNI